MKCSVCKEYYCNDNISMCYYCNVVICYICCRKYEGTPEKRFFKTYNKVSCYSCYTRSKFLNEF